MSELSLEDAEEVVEATWESGARQRALYYRDGQCVGYRWWSESGAVTMEYGLKDGQMHGPFRTWHDNGQLCEESSYEHGMEHGVARQYDWDGSLIGSYTMVHGTGVDLWFAAAGVLTEERHYLDGQRHGYERWWGCCDQLIYEESHFRHGQEHGIQRQWNSAGRLRRGYPRYFVAGARVTRRQYERARRTDPTLPPFVAADNAPTRPLPKALTPQPDGD